MPAWHRRDSALPRRDSRAAKLALAGWTELACGRMRLLDRYLLRELLVPFGYCLSGFIIFWISFDRTLHFSG